MAQQTRNASKQKKLAAKILKCGESRVWISPELGTKLEAAITRQDIRNLIRKGKIKKLPAKENPPHVEHRRQNIGSRKGAKGARVGKKDMWFRVVRPQRKLLKELRPKLVEGAYRKLYGLVKGNVFRSRAHLTTYVNEKKLLTDEKKK
ncbi:MAG TPA: 50S ribosomal protein L19e [archaeon]|nr:50S ribosomal protein L19e [archaeon]